LQVDDTNYNSEGLPNIGNTCYLNSAIQTLNSIDELPQFLNNSKDKASYSWIISHIFAQMALSSEDYNKNSLLQALNRKLQEDFDSFRPGLQHDSL
jgi:ubiquitin C-terminal hydrolase